MRLSESGFIVALLAPLLPPNLVILRVNDMIPSSVTARTAVAADDYIVTLLSLEFRISLHQKVRVIWVRD
jgi:hypothetical protein